MRFNILTIHKEPNYGACLQAYALYHALETLGCEARMINLSLDYRGRDYSLKNRLLMPLYRVLKGYDYCFRKAEAFSRKHTACRTANFNTPGQLEAFHWDADDAFIIGSDQVWNPSITQRLSKVFCLDFLPDECEKRYSYAASLGSIKDEMERTSQLDMDAIRKLRKVGVRESFGAAFLKKHGGMDATVVVDPTLLLDDYTHLLERQPQPRKEVLLLTLSDNGALAAFCEQVASEAAMPIRKLYGYLQPERGKNRKFVSVEGWLQSIAEAEMVVTDSFHACVFAIMFRKQFVFFTQEAVKRPRVENLFHHLGIPSERIVSEPRSVAHMAPIDYSEVGRRLCELRAESIDFLKSIVEDARKG